MVVKIVVQRELLFFAVVATCIPHWLSLVGGQVNDNHTVYIQTPANNSHSLYEFSTQSYAKLLNKPLAK